MRKLLGRYLRQAPPEILAPFAHEGEARVRMWLEGPGSFQDPEYAGRRVYTEQQLFYGISVMRARRTPRKARAARRPTLQ